MEKQKFSSSVATICTLTLAATGLANCNSVENQSLAQLKSVQTVAPLSQPVSQTALAAPTSDPTGAATIASASGVTSAPLDPATVILQKTGRLTAQQAASDVNTQMAAISPQATDATDPSALATVAAAVPASPEYYVIPGRVAVPTPRPGTKFADAAPLEQPADLAVLQQMAAIKVAAPVPTTSTKLAPQEINQEALAAPQAAAQQPVLLASSVNDPGYYIIPGRVAVPEPRPGSELAYAPSTAGSAAEAIAMQAPNAQVQTQIAALAPPAAPQLQAVGQDDPAKPHSFLNDLIFKYSMLYGVPEHFVHRVAKRESTYNPKAYRAGNYGLMQIRLNTAKGLGYKGDAKGLFDAETNLKYAVKYLRGAWLVADGNEDRADKLYIKGYYFDAKRKGLLAETEFK